MCILAHSSCVIGHQITHSPCLQSDITSRHITCTGPKTALQILTSSFPSSTIGTFYQFDGTPMTPFSSPTSSPSSPSSSSPSTSSSALSAYVSVPYNATMQSYAIRFRPAKNKYSSKMYYAFSYTMYNTVTGVRSLGYVIKMYVSHVNKPPVPSAGLLAYVLQVQYSNHECTPVLT